jgi:uncharacterized peroxidase-related enzyme
MSRVPLIQLQQAAAEIATHFQAIEKGLGAIPNMFKAVANSNAALKSMWGAFGALGGGKLGAKLGEQIAVAVANRNGCDYCLAAHYFLGKGAGLTPLELSGAQVGESADPKTAIVLAFALKLVKNRGQVNADDVEHLRAAGFSNELVVEIIAHVALNLFTNYINIALDVPLDFPKIELQNALS